MNFISCIYIFPPEGSLIIKKLHNKLMIKKMKSREMNRSTWSMNIQVTGKLFSCANKVA